MSQLTDQIRRIEKLVLGPEKPQGEPKSEGEWVSLIREVDRAFNAGFCHRFKKPHYSDEEKAEILSLRLHVEKLVDEFG